MKKCLICGDEAKYDLCYKCFLEKNKIKLDLDGSINTLEETKDYYNNLKYNIFKLKNMEYAKTGCLKLLALAEVLEQEYNQKGFIEKSKKDVDTLLNKKKEYLEKLKNGSSTNDNINDDMNLLTNDYRSILKEEQQPASDEVLDYRRVYPMQYRCKDGHYVRSKSEKFIDDALFEAKKIHVYEKRVKNVDTGEDYYPDFYLPFEGSDGVYIEHFGLENNENYLKTEKKKMAYYKTQNFCVIEVREKNISCINEYLEDELFKINKKIK